MLAETCAFGKKKTKTTKKNSLSYVKVRTFLTIYPIEMTTDSIQ